MNCKEDMTLGDLVKSAKKRMKQGFWRDVIKERKDDIIRAESQGLSKRQVIEEYKNKIMQDLYIKSDRVERDAALYRQAVEIFESGELISNPLARLVEHEYYDELDDDGKVGYMLELSTRFLKCKEQYEHDKHTKS